jgi:hypothetical protein
VLRQQGFHRGAARLHGEAQAHVHGHLMTGAGASAIGQPAAQRPNIDDWLPTTASGKLSRMPIGGLVFQ